MTNTKICLCLTAPTLQENLDVLNKNRKWVDIAELRADYLNPDEILHIRNFPDKANIPTILTVRRVSDGGTFAGGEANRTTIFARALAFANQDARKNFAYIDLEEDFRVSSLQDAAMAFGIKIIRSFHSMQNSNFDILEKMNSLRKSGLEIPKIACMANSLSDTTKLFKETKTLGFERIVCAMGEYGLTTRILAKQLGSFLTYCSPSSAHEMQEKIGHIDPQSLNELYGFRGITTKTEIFGVSGYPLKKTGSPLLHGTGYRLHGINAVYVPIKAKTTEEMIDFAEEVGIKGLSVTVPHKENVIDIIKKPSNPIKDIGACNTILKKGKSWVGFNTDANGLKRALIEFVKEPSLKGKKVALIGGGGSARAAAYALHEMGCDVCVFNRTIIKARNIAELYGFKYEALGLAIHHLLEEYSWLILNTTSVGMGWSEEESTEKEDPLEFYNFTGNEKVYDIIYYPEKTPLLIRAEKAGCQICNGYSMLQYQAYEQFEIFTGVKYE